jgi:GntR family transcriptional regulator
MTAVRPDRSRPDPLWSQVLHDLRDRLAAGEFDQGFPTDHELMASYDVSRHTVREAVRHLQEEGVLTRERGRGSFVRQPDLQQPVGPLYSLFRSIEDQGFEQRSIVIIAEETVDEAAAERLDVDPDELLAHLRRLRLADQVPIAVDDLWIPATIGRPLLGVDLEHTAVYTELERLTGVSPAAGWERISPGLADLEEQALLGIDSSQAVFVIERRTTTADLTPIEWRRTVVRGDRYTFVTNWDGTDATNPKFAPRSG